MHAFPVPAHRVPLATLTLYGRSAGALTADATGDAAILADLAGTVVARDLDGTLTREPQAGNRPYADSAVASGIISVRHRLGVDDAPARMRAAAYARGVSVSALAAGIVAGRDSLD